MSKTYFIRQCACGCGKETKPLDFLSYIKLLENTKWFYSQKCIDGSAFNAAEKETAKAELSGFTIQLSDF